MIDSSVVAIIAAFPTGFLADPLVSLEVAGSVFILSFFVKLEKVMAVYKEAPRK